MPALWHTRAQQQILALGVAFLLIGELLLPGILSAPRPAHAQGPADTVTVTTTADDADGDVASLAALNAQPGPDARISLREAISAANGTPAGAELTIRFSIPAADPGYDAASDTWRIQPLSALPALARGGVLVDGTQPLTPERVRIVLDGLQAYDPPDLGNGITITSANNTIRRLGLVNFYDSGVIMSGAAARENRVVGCAIGINAGEDEAEPNDVGVELRGGANTNVIGGADPADRNIISGNLSYGVQIVGAGTVGNLLAGNWIGTGHGGATPVGNVNRGVLVGEGAAANLIGQAGMGNVIADNGIGVELSSAASRNIVAGNVIGLAADGVAPRADPQDPRTSLGNSDGGIFITGAANNNLIGGSGAGEGNIVSNNGDIGTAYGHGIYLNNSGSLDNTLQGNYIGVDRTGIVGRGNLIFGISILEGANRTVVGGSAAGARNVIAFNGAGGIRVGSASNAIAGNLIGVGADGVTPLGNQQNGVRVIGAGNAVGQGNIIAYNQLSGVVVEPSASGAAITDNTIHDNDISGVCVRGSGTTVASNYIHHNGRYKVFATDCDILGGVVVDRASRTEINANTIADNHNVGIRISGGSSNRIEANSITSNVLSGIQLMDGGNAGLPPPLLDIVTPQFVSGRSCAGCTVEFFADTADEGAIYIGATVAAQSGRFSMALPPFPLAESNLTATNTDPSGNTSGFAAPVLVPLQQELGTRLYLPAVKR